MTLHDASAFERNAWLQVAHLFQAHDDLLEEFTFFLPDSKAPHRAAMERARLANEQRAATERAQRRLAHTEVRGNCAACRFVAVISLLSNSWPLLFWVDSLHFRLRSSSPCLSWLLSPRAKPQAIVFRKWLCPTDMCDWR